MITKSAQPPYWPKILSGLRKMPNLPSNVRELISSPQRLVFHPSTPQGANPMAKAYVTTEDSDEDGNLDTVNMVVTNIEKEIPSDILSKINQLPETDPAFQEVVSNVAKTLVHELAHLDDYTVEHGFRGGEAIAESKERAFEPTFAQYTTNKNIGIDNVLNLGSEGGLKMKQELVKLANHLDNIGHRDLADRVDEILKSSGILGDAWEGAKDLGQKALRGQLAVVGPGSYYELTSALKSLWKSTTCKGTPGLSPCEPMSSLSGMNEEFLGKLYGVRGVTEENDGPVAVALEKNWINDTFLNALETWGQDRDRRNAPQQDETGPMASTPEDADLVADDEVSDFVLSSENMQDRINKMAELMSREFTTGVPKISS